MSDQRVRAETASLRRPLRKLAVIVLLASLQATGVLHAQTPATPPTRIAVIADRMDEHLRAQALHTGSGSDEATRRLAAEALRAARTHPEVRSVAEERGFTEAATREARSQWLPQLDSTLDTGKRRATNAQLADSSIDTQSGAAYGLSMKQLLYDFGAVTNSVGASVARERSVGARLETRRSEIMLRGATAWIELERARQLESLAADNLASRSAIVAMVRERADLGGSAPADVVRAQAREADARAALVAARIELQRALPAYREAFGVDAGSTELPADLPLPVLQQSLSDLSRRFGGLREAQAQIDASKADARAASARSLPTVSLELNASRRENGVGGGPTEDTLALVVLRYRLFTGYADEARTEQSRRRASQSEEEFDRLLRQVERSIEQVIAQIQQAESLLEARRAAVISASDSMAAVKEQFAFNRGSLLELLKVQEDLYNAGRDLVAAVADRALARFRLLHLTSELEPRLSEAAASVNRR